MWIIFIVYVCISAVFADNVVFKDCGSVSGKIASVDVTPCPSEPCQLKKGTVAQLSVNFTSNVDTKTGKTVVHGIINNIPVPYPVPAGKFVPDLPLKQNANVVYSNSLSVLKSDPKISLLVKWEVQDDTGKDLICFVVPCLIVD